MSTSNQRRRSSDLTGPRFTVADLDRIPLFCGPLDLAWVFGHHANTIGLWHKRGLLKRFEVKDAVGPKRWSGVLIRRHLETSATAEPERRFFGSARRQKVG